MDPGGALAPDTPSYQKGRPVTDETVPETPVADLTRGTWIQLIDEDGYDHGEAEVLHVELAGRCAVLMFRTRSVDQPVTVYFDDATNTVPVLTAERLAELKATAERAERAERIAEIRAFADFLEQNPWAPIPNDFVPMVHLDERHVGGPTAAESYAKARDLADRLGVELEERLDDRSKLRRSFGAGVSYEVIAWHPGGRPVEAPAEPDGLDYQRDTADGSVPGPRPAPHFESGRDPGAPMVDRSPLKRDEINGSHLFVAYGPLEQDAEVCARAGCTLPPADHFASASESRS